MTKGKKKVEVVEENETQARAAAAERFEQKKDAQGPSAPGETEATGAVGQQPEQEDLAERLEKAEREARENYDRFLRVSAEFENYRKRAAREKEDYRKFSTEKLVKELLPVVDNLERALVSAEDPAAEQKAIKDGVDLTLREILRVLERFGVKAIQSLNEPFDPAYHQAMMQEPRENVPGNTVITELQKGYTLHDRLLRPAMVIVSTPTAAEESDAGESG